MMRLVLFLMGMFLTSLGLFFVVLYLNLFAMGYSLYEFVKFIIVRLECYLILIGVLIMIFTWKGKLRL